jgi:uncharacterized repeat protein (TIGR04138 family)
VNRDELLAELDDLLASDNRYRLESYLFVMNALEFTMSRLQRPGHVTGRELLDGIRTLARREFGPMARAVFESWGVRQTSDFGEIVFNLIDAGLFGKRDEDSRSDFKDVYDFAEVFEDQYDWSIDGVTW